MSDSVPFLLKLMSAIGCGLVAGVFFAFSSFVMTALSRLPAAQGIAAMQSINVVVINVSFMALLFGTAAICLAVGVWSAVTWHRPGSAIALTGVAIYLVGTIGTTIALNVPRNDQLAQVDPTHPASEVIWETYLHEWTRANHLRTAAALGAAVLLTLSLTRGAD